MEWYSTGEFTKEDIDCLKKSKQIIERGNTAEIKRKSDGTMVVYEVKKEKK